MSPTQLTPGLLPEELAAIVLASSDATDLERELAKYLEAVLSYIDSHTRQ